MSIKWTRNQSESGILRKNDVKEKKEELFVFGYSCKLFRDDEKAQHIDQGKHLIPWMGDETLKIDRYDARGALHNLGSLEAPSGGFDWRVELTKNEQDVEQLCDEERYRALHTDEDEEEMYKEEELKRLHAAGYGQVGFNYEAPAEPEPPAAEVDEPFLAHPALVAMLSDDIVLPDTEKLNAIIEKTAKFIASQGAQMEILLRAKQADNPQFKFLDKESPLHKYYMELTALVKAGRWPEKAKEESLVEDKPRESDEYLHPSLGSAFIESAPSIPSLHYRPSADCDYTLLISKMRGEATLDEPYEPAPAPGDEAPPGTTPLALPPPETESVSVRAPHIARAPVLYSQMTAEQQATESYYANYAAYYQQYMEEQARLQAPPPAPPPAPPTPAPAPARSAGLELVDNYNTDSDSDDSDSDTSSGSSKVTIPTPPEETQVVIDKMAAYVARNGDEFADIVRAKNDPRFAFLEPDHEYHRWYLRLMREKRGVGNGEKEKKSKKGIAPVSFSIKKLKEPDPVLPKPALPYESSEDEADKTEAEAESKAEVSESPQTPPPPVIVYKVQNNVQLVAETHADLEVPKTIPTKTEEAIKKPEKPIQKIEKTKTYVEVVKSRSATPTERRRERDEAMAKKEKEKRRRDVRRREERERKRKRKRRKEEEEEIISLDDAEEFIDLTGDVSDAKDKNEESEADKAKQVERRRRAAEFLRKVGVDPAGAAALPAASLASAMVDTLESIRKKKAEEEEKKRKREKKRHREKYENGESASKKSRRRKYSDDDQESEHDSKRKKHKKEKKHSRSKKKRRRSVSSGSEGEGEGDVPAEGVTERAVVSADLKSTLQQLRAPSPAPQPSPPPPGVLPYDSSSDDESQVVRPERAGKRRRGEREYSEGEWSSDSARSSPAALTP